MNRIIKRGEIMKKTFSLWALCGFAFVSAFGTILHYLYEWTGGNAFIALFSGVNESTWEHMKLLFFPMLVFAIIQSFFFKDQKNFWCVKLYSTLLGLILIPAIFYTYNGVVGKSPDWINIAIFFISAAIAYYFESRLFKSGKIKCERKKIAILSFVIIAVLFGLFTFFTPRLGIFLDPVLGGYGIS